MGLFNASFGVGHPVCELLAKRRKLDRDPRSWFEIDSFRRPELKAVREMDLDTHLRQCLLGGVLYAAHKSLRHRVVLKY